MANGADERSFAKAKGRSGEIAARVREALAHWNELDVDPDAYAVAIEAGLVSDGGEELAAIRWDELVLVHACVQAHPAALKILERSYLAPATDSLARLRLPVDVQQEIGQKLREHLLCPRGERPLRLASYRGRGPLLAWVKTTAARLVAESQRNQRTLSPDVLGQAHPDQKPDPELDYFRTVYRTEFKQAFADAVANLDRRSRNLLRYSLVDGLTHEQIGRIYHIARQTVGRQVAQTCDALVSSLRELLRERLGLNPSELQSVMRLLQSERDLSLVTLLGGTLVRSGSSSESPPTHGE